MLRTQWGHWVSGKDVLTADSLGLVREKVEEPVSTLAMILGDGYISVYGGQALGESGFAP